jgi:hypothetical protein
MGSTCSKPSVKAVPQQALVPPSIPVPDSTVPVEAAPQDPSPPPERPPPSAYSHWTDGSRYVGEFRNGVRNGHGVFQCEDGSRYDGEWADDVRHGRGIFISAAGDEYTGDFASDEMHGRGEMRWVCGDVYTGEFRRGRREGEGEFVWAATNDKYKGRRPKPQQTQSSGGGLDTARQMLGSWQWQGLFESLQAQRSQFEAAAAVAVAASALLSQPPSRNYTARQRVSPWPLRTLSNDSTAHTPPLMTALVESSKGSACLSHTQTI